MNHSMSRTNDNKSDSQPGSNTDGLELLNFNPISLSHDFQVYHQEAAESYAAAELLDEARKTMYHRLVIELVENSTKSGGKRLSMELAKSYAYVDDRYLELQDKALKAKALAAELKVKAESYKIYLDLLRTKQANIRNEMGRFN